MHGCGDLQATQASLLILQGVEAAAQVVGTLADRTRPAAGHRAAVSGRGGWSAVRKSSYRSTGERVPAEHDVTGRPTGP